WYFGSSASGIGASQSDFVSVAVRELGYLLGFGTADSFSTYVSGTNFVGPASIAAHGGSPVPLYTDLAHWADGTMSTVGLTSHSAAMDATFINGTRTMFTSMDYASMSDVGWQVPAPVTAPEPMSGLL